MVERRPVTGELSCFRTLTPVSAIRPWRVTVVCLFLTAIFWLFILSYMHREF